MNKTTIGAWVLAACAGLSGCASSPLSTVYPYAPDLKPVPLGFAVVDRRLSAESESEVLSPHTTNENDYGIARLGDAQVTPNRVAYLAVRLQEKAGDRLRGGTLTIERFTIHLNKQGAGAPAAVSTGSFDDTRPFVDTELSLRVGAQWLSTRQRVNVGNGPEATQVAGAIRASIDAAADDIGKRLVL